MRRGQQQPPRVQLAIVRPISDPLPPRWFAPILYDYAQRDGIDWFLLYFEAHHTCLWFTPDDLLTLAAFVETRPTASHPGAGRPA